MSGYLTAWRAKPDTPAGRILKVISEAGDCYHGTEGWADPYNDDETSQMDIIESFVEKECSALEQALAEKEREVERLTALVAEYRGDGYLGEVERSVAVNAAIVEERASIPTPKEKS